MKISASNKTRQAEEHAHDRNIILYEVLQNETMRHESVSSDARPGRHRTVNVSVLM